MNPAKQFWTLFKFHLIANPYIWIYVFAACTPLLFMAWNERSLDSVIGNQNLFFVGMLGIMFLAPEMLGSSTSVQYPIFASECVLTRAVDRYIFARAKSAGFYFLVLLVPIFLFLFSLKNPDLKTLSLSKSENQECLSALPGSVVIKNPRGLDYIAIPAGKILVASWKIWECLLTAAAAQLLIVLVYPLPHRNYFFWGIVVVGVFLPFLALYFKVELSTGERLFFTFAAHQSLFWIETFFFVILSQLWCERRFVRQEL